MCRFEQCFLQISIMLAEPLEEIQCIWTDVLGFVAVCHSSAVMTEQMEFFIKCKNE